MKQKKVEKYEIKFYLFADDIVLYAENSNDSISNCKHQ